MAEWAYFNPNPNGSLVGDCVIRAICAVTGQDWEETYTGLALQAYVFADLPNSNHVWRAYLKSKGYQLAVIPNTCPDCYTVADFADDHPEGSFILGTGTHAVAVIRGTIYDTWDSRWQVPVFYYYKS